MCKFPTGPNLQQRSEDSKILSIGSVNTNNDRNSPV